MIKSVVISKNRKTYKVTYFVRYANKEMKFTKENVPATVKRFIETHPYTNLSGSYAYKFSDALRFE